LSTFARLSGKKKDNYEVRRGGHEVHSQRDTKRNLIKINIKKICFMQTFECLSDNPACRSAVQAGFERLSG